MTLLKTDRRALYESDYLQWIETTVEKLRSQDYGDVDWGNLIEEIVDMGRSERRSLDSNFIVVLLHLLKWQYQPNCRSGSWEGSLLEYRRCIRKALQESLSLKPYCETVLIDCYADAVKQAKAKTGLPLETFPLQCPYDSIAILDDEFLP